jgi:hypothetical protein
MVGGNWAKHEGQLGGRSRTDWMEEEEVRRARLQMFGNRSGNKVTDLG